MQYIHDKTGEIVRLVGFWRRKGECLLDYFLIELGLGLVAHQVILVYLLV
jgi:hypothetical protein